MSESSPKFAFQRRLADCKRMPWKNGQGETLELAISPPDADFSKLDFDWRLSSASVKVGGPFSEFPEFERVLGLIEGQELVLRFPQEGRVVNLVPGKYLRFSGDSPVQAELPKGEVQDLGLIYRPELFVADMRTIPFSSRTRSFAIQQSAVFFLVLEGAFSAITFPGEEQFSLSQGDFLAVAPQEPGMPAAERICLFEPKSGDGRIVAVEIAARDVKRPPLAGHT